MDSTRRTPSSSDPLTGTPEAGADDGARDNAADSAAPDVADDVLGSRVSPDDAAPLQDDDPGRTRQDGDTAQPRTGAETPVDAEDLVHARGQDTTPVTLDRAARDLEDDAAGAVEDTLPGR